MDLLKWLQLFVGGRTAVEDLIEAGKANPDLAEHAQKAEAELAAAISEERIVEVVAQLPAEVKNIIALKLDPRDSPSADI